MGCLSLKLFPQLASRLSDSLFPTKSHERTVEQAREEVELDVDVVHVECPSSRIAQRDGCWPSLRLDIADRYLIFTPQLVYVAVLPQDVLHRSVERPGNDLQRAPVELAQEFGVFVVAQPDEEVTGCAVSVHVAAAFRSRTGTFEASVGYPYGVCHTLDEGAERRAVSVAAHSLRLQLVGVCQFVEQYAAGFEQHLGRNDCSMWRVL